MRSNRTACVVVATLVVVLCLAPAGVARAQTESAPTRLVILKFDGLPPGAVDRYVHKLDPRTGKSVLPWIERLFYADGVRFENFYSRGASLSEPSWAILDTGQHGIIKGNFEVDRNTGSVGYYLDFVSYYYAAAKSRRVYPQSVESLDAARTPLLSDAFRFEERETGLQLNRRGTKFYDFLKIGLQPLSGPVSERLGDLVVGVDFHRAFDVTTREAFLKSVRDPAIRYADYYGPNVDEVIHDDNSEESIVAALRDTDRIVGQTFAAIAESGAADRTLLVVVSDHGLTYDEGGQYSQGVDLLSYLTKREFGANTVISHDGPLAKYTLKGSVFNPWIGDSVVTPSPSPFLPKRAGRVTCALDYDGNERAQLQLRSADLNRLELLVDALRRGSLDAPRRAAVTSAALTILDAHRAAWSGEAQAIREEVAAVRRRILAAASELAAVTAAIDARQGTAGAPPSVATQPGPILASAINTTDPAVDQDQRRKELKAELWRLGTYADEYTRVADTLDRRAQIRTAEALLSTPIDALVGASDLGDRPTAGDLLHYPAGLGEIVLHATGALDTSKSFVTVNYLDALAGIRIRNSVRRDVGTAPVAFCATTLPVGAATARAVAAGLVDASDAVSVTSAFLLYGSTENQLLFLVRSAPGGDASILAAPISNFDMSSATGAVTFERGAWRAGLPLGLFEDAALDTRGADRSAWLAGFHADREWLAATHRTAMGLGVSNLVEVLSTDYRAAFADAAADADADARLVRRLELRRRDAMAPDLFVHAAPHWNFDVKDFNPGGNHGGFGRQSMHAVMWMNGGYRTRVVRGPLVVTEPYDGLDFAPTVFEAAGVTTNGRLPVDLVVRGFRPFPGRIVRQVLRPNE